MTKNNQTIKQKAFDKYMEEETSEQYCQMVWMCMDDDGIVDECMLSDMEIEYSEMIDHWEA